MPPKRNIKLNKTKPPQLTQLNNENNSADAIESELKFDQEVLWCITQFEKLIKSGKINDAKKQESIKAIMTLKKANVSKIEKIQLMKSYFKDYKSKMARDEEVIRRDTELNFESLDDCKSNGKFLKKKVENVKNLPESNAFFFNFNNSNENDGELEEAVNKMSLS